MSRKPSIPRLEAQMEGEPTYDSGTPCKHGHVGPRFVANRTCCECARQKKRMAAKAPNIIEQLVVEAHT